MCCIFFFFCFCVYIHREHLNLMQWAVSTFLENIFCLWVEKDRLPFCRKYKLEIIYPIGFVLQQALSACIFSVLPILG